MIIIQDWFHLRKPILEKHFSKIEIEINECLNKI